MYGACHVGRPFFVCELANFGTASAYLQEKPSREVWWSLYRAALGLQHLHECGILHGDLKGNSFLVTGDEDKTAIKLADFGLSAFVDRAETAAGNQGAIGAFRWKAPERLPGAAPSFASDVYSFGMCILELSTGEYPWGEVYSRCSCEAERDGEEVVASATGQLYRYTMGPCPANVLLRSSEATKCWCSGYCLHSMQSTL
ncbi:unnamed protein product [Phytophthora lilii]|uniref:Unnamed protein product n=1 Tax=Phytophthora lilii TaxID=2077276 RepID=A0A9W6WMA0_9STRA|nr:unnamed protein product [Phytophthora lilii]